MIVVCNASPLISLARIGQLPLLHTLFADVWIAAEVHQEVAVAGAGRPAALVVQKAPWLQIQASADPTVLVEWQARHPALGKGELATLLLAKSSRADWTIIDERAARRVASDHGLKVIGCIGILELAHRRGLVSDLRTVYASLEPHGIRVHPDILNRSLTSLGLPPLGRKSI